MDKSGIILLVLINAFDLKHKVLVHLINGCIADEISYEYPWLNLVKPFFCTELTVDTHIIKIIK